jgi:hypothetical protein
MAHAVGVCRRRHGPADTRHQHPQHRFTPLARLVEAGKPVPGASETESPLLDDSIKAAARYTTKYLICRHSGACPATPDASTHIVAPHPALGLR